MRKFNMIWVEFRKEGIHRYPAAVDLPGVEFLANPHRHIFHFRVEIEVFHEDRDIEFILMKRELENLYGNGTLEVDFKSCEMLANDLLGYLGSIDKYKGRTTVVSVSEDGENGATVYSIEEPSHDRQATANPGSR